MPRWTLLLLIGAAIAVGVGIGLGQSGATQNSRVAASSALSPVAPPLIPDPAALRGGRAATRGGATVGRAVPTPPAPLALDGTWLYRPDPTNVGLADSWGQGGAPKTGWTAVTMPNDFNALVSGAGFQGRTAWYETKFTGPAITSGRSWQVSFEGVRRNATVFLNGYELGTHRNPYAPFSLPAPTLVPGQTNTLIVRVDNLRGAVAFPEDWWNWGGIVGPVTLEPVGRMSVNELGVTPELGCSYRCGDLRVQGTLVNNSPTTLAPRIAVRVRAPLGEVTTVTRAYPRIKPGASLAVSFPVTIRSPRLWSPASPSLYSVEVKTEVGARVEEADSLAVGMRSVRVAGGILYLNGHRLWLHGASIHEDTIGQGAALTDADIETIVAELKSVGANVTRAHYQLSPRLLGALDRAGIMVWAQPAVDHADGKLATAAGRAQALSMLRSTLVEDRNHPSVIVDSVGNELSVTPDSTPGTLSYLTQAIKLARVLNPTVPVGLDIYCYTNLPAQQVYKQLDVIGISDYFGWATGPPGHSIASFNQLTPYLLLQHRRYPDQALVISEYGAEAFYDGASTTKGTYEFQSSYLQQTYGVLDQLPFLNGAIYWTLREFAVNPGWTGGATLPPGYVPDGIHHKGLLAYDGSPKPAFAVAQQLFATQPGYVPVNAVSSRRGPQSHSAFCNSGWCANGPGGHLLPSG